MRDGDERRARLVQRFEPLLRREPVDVAAERDHRLVEYVGEACRHPAVTLTHVLTVH